MFCIYCGKLINNESVFCVDCGDKMNITSNKSIDFNFTSNSLDSYSVCARYEYKILTQKDKWFSSKFDPINLEQALNAYAQHGWRVISCATADILGIRKSRQEFIAVLERRVK